LTTFGRVVRYECYSRVRQHLFDGKPMLSKGDSKNVGAVEAHKTNDECKTNKHGANCKELIILEIEQVEYELP